MAGEAVCNTIRSSSRRGTRRYGQARQESCGWCLATFLVGFGCHVVYCGPDCRFAAKYFRRYWRGHGADTDAKLRERHAALIQARRGAYTRMCEQGLTELPDVDPHGHYAGDPPFKTTWIRRGGGTGASYPSTRQAQTAWRDLPGVASTQAVEAEWQGFGPTDIDALVARIQAANRSAL